MSAAELLMMFHFYFTGNPEGLIFDVAAGRCRARSGSRSPRGSRDGASLSTPPRRYVASSGATPAAGWSSTTAGRTEATLLVLALDVAALQRLVDASPALAPPRARRLRPARRRIRSPSGGCGSTARWRRIAPRSPARPASGCSTTSRSTIGSRTRAPPGHARTADRWSSCTPMRCPRTATKTAIKRATCSRACTRSIPRRAQRASSTSASSLRHDCPAFPPAAHARRPGVTTALPTWRSPAISSRMPFPCALMERAAASGFLAANIAPGRLRRAGRAHPLGARARSPLASTTCDVVDGGARVSKRPLSVFGRILPAIDVRDERSDVAAGELGVDPAAR